MFVVNPSAYMLPIPDNLFSYPSDNLLVSGDYALDLVLLSVGVAIFTSFMGLQVAAQAVHRHSRYARQLSLLSGSIALGGGVWAMHFIGMLAFNLCTPVEYEWHLTSLSMLPAIAASWVALHMIARKSIRFTQLLCGGLLVGGGIGTMHYVGMAAMQMALSLRYDMTMFVCSLLVAVLLAMLALWIHFGLSSLFHRQLKPMQKTAIASVVMGLAIAGMHYTGMAAARFVRPPGLEISTQGSEISAFLAIGVTLITIIITTFVLVANLALGYRDVSLKAQNNERRLIVTMDTALDSIISLNQAGRIVSTNKAVEQLLGWSQGQLIGQELASIVPNKQSAAQSVADLTRLVEDKQQKGAILKGEVLHKSGEVIPVLFSIGQLETKQEKLFVAFISDQRQRNKMESALRENDAKFRSLLANIPGIAYRCMFAENWPMEYVSDEVANITGYPAADFVMPAPKRSLETFYHPDDLAKIKQLKCTIEQRYSFEYRIVDRHGKVKWMLEFGQLVNSEDKQHRWCDGIIMDISQRKEMEQQLIDAKEHAEAAAASRAAFMANMSHEIRTPMNAVIGFSDLLLESQLSAEQQRFLNTINQSAKSLMHLLNDVLDSAKLDKGKMELEYREFSLIEEVDAVISTLWLQARNKGLKIELDIAPELAQFYWGAPDRLRQVLTNLVGNAVKFTERGRVMVSVKPGDNHMVEFCIEDTGIGMSEEQLARVFDPFSQADATMSRRFGGTGLGTTISKQLVELMGGSITAQSRLAQGSVFRFSIPLTVRETLPETVNGKGLSLPPLHILVVDDIEQNLDLLRILLSRDGHQVITARDGQQALTAMAQNELDLVLMDIQMPVMDGLAATLERRSYEQLQGLAAMPIIAITASVLLEDKNAAFAAGMDGFANKPINMPLLNGEIARVLKLTPQLLPNGGHNDVERQTIDLESGVSLWGNRQRFLSEIRQFIDTFAQSRQELDTACEQHNWHELNALVHRYRGVSSNLALQKLAARLHDIEQRLMTKQYVEIAGLCLQLNDDILAVQTRLQQLAAQDVDVTFQAEQESSELFVAYLQQTLTMVTHNEFDEELLQLLQQVTPTRYQSHVAKINLNINDFEFEQAKSAIRALLQLFEEGNEHVGN